VAGRNSVTLNIRPVKECGFIAVYLGVRDRETGSSVFRVEGVVDVPNVEWRLLGLMREIIPRGKSFLSRESNG
jgi:hypothetical protein